MLTGAHAGLLATACLLAATASGQERVVSTVAGLPPFSGSADGVGTAARFNKAAGIAVGPGGIVYVADTQNDTIREIAPGGVVTTLAGQAGNEGSTDGPGALARFLAPSGIAVDQAGNVYVADTDNCTIREITPDGTVSTVAGLALSSGSADGVGSAARFNYPWGIAVDSAGSLYVADWGGNAIRKIAPGGSVTTLARGSTSAPASFSSPIGVAVDASGNVYVSDSLNDAILKIAPGGTVTLLAGTDGTPGAADGTGSAAAFEAPHGLALDSQGNLYVADSGNATVRMVSPSGTVSTIAGTAPRPGYADGVGAQAQFSYPEGIAVDASGNLYIADTANNAIRLASSSSGSAPPLIQSQPTGLDASPGQTATFSVTASGSGALGYQWYKNGVAIAGATGTSLTLADVQSSDDGLYSVVVTDSSGSQASSLADLAVGAPPVIQGSPQSQTVQAGATVTLQVAAADATNYEWMFNGAVIAGATASTLQITNIGSDQAGVYSVIVSNSLAADSPVSATITVTSDSRLVNLSARAVAGAGDNALVAGFVIAGTGSKEILLRGIGPALADFGVSDALADPSLALYASGMVTATADDVGWGGAATLAQTFARVGAFALTAGSADSAMLKALPPGAYSEEVTGADGDSGVALAEIYDADTGSPTAQLTNLSSRAQVGTGSNVLAAGFVIAGSTPETVLVRAVGPSLEQFGVDGFLSNPVLTLYDSSGSIVATAIGWSGSRWSQAFTAVGAFPLSNSADCALIETLPPGAYSAVVSGNNGTTGIALVEVYAVPGLP